jgi:uncharacterized protein (TIGR00661 family)
MEQPFREKMTGKPRILVAPLDWGLGHATRCIPIIRELLVAGADVWLAGEGAQEELLKAEFPDLPFLTLPGYRVQYAKTARGLFWKMIQQGPKMQKAIRAEHQWLKKIITTHAFDIVISDNRYGLYHATVPCVFITHQLTIKSPLGRWTEKILQQRNYKYINRFTACWVPDIEAGNNLAGELSHPEKMPAIPVQYIGWLSRFKKTGLPVRKNHLLIVLSGPEPQRTVLEEKIIAAIGHYNHTATIVRALPGSSAVIPSTNMIKFYNHLPAASLNMEMEEAEYVISHSGYSTVMDVLAMEKKSILIPTPGQTEQEYLGASLMNKKMALSIPQKDFSLDKALAAAAGFNYEIPVAVSNPHLSTAVAQILRQS